MSDSSNFESDTVFPKRIFAREPARPTLPPIVEVPARAPPERDASDYAPRRPAPNDAKLLTALADTLSQQTQSDALRMTAQCIFDLRFHDLIELCTRAIGKNEAKLKVEPYDLATGLSGWAIEQLARKDE